MKRKNIFFLTLILAFLFFSGVIFLMYKIVSNTPIAEFVQNDFIQEKIKQSVPSSDIRSVVDFLPKFLGMEKPITYLVLLQNNTEMRPGGGFIGSYAVVRMDKGVPEIIIVDGVENLDRNTPDTWKPKPPQVLTDELGVDRWYFRDSNWSPDYVDNVLRGLYYYEEEGGTEAKNIDAVIAFTPTVLEKFLQKIGPVTVQGITFTEQNVVEKLEREVEYDYADKGIAFQERKQILKPFMEVLVKEVVKDGFFHLSDYMTLFHNLAIEKHILVYSKDRDIQKMFDSIDWSGRVKQTKGDYLLWVDANLAALKTDHAIKRNITYAITPYGRGGYKAKVSMEYRHTGVFDWRTSRYRTFARVYVPKGSVFLNVSGVKNGEEVVKGVDGDKNWFGVFYTLEPGETGIVSFEYLLPENIVTMIQSGNYTLLAQKQLGTIAHGLTLDLNFGKTISRTVPESKNEEVFSLVTDLQVDREFAVQFK
ncbi:MAG: DUF4012 domain-containing protein [Candidatus Magasanikbacteria bacterium]